jgi:hypothetical protein
MEFLKIYLELDALLDTRLAVLHALSPDAAAQVVADDRYYHRLSNDFSWAGISKEVFDEAWDARTADVLPDATITQIPFVLGEMVHQLELAHMDNPTARKPLVEVNVWPYELTEAERVTLTNAVLRRAGLDTTVTVTRFDPQKDLTMLRLRKEYASLFMYNFTEWVNAHQQEMQRVIAPRTTVMAPTLFEQRVPNEEDLRAYGLHVNTDPAVLVEKAFAEFIALDAMPTYFFCIARPDREAEWRAMYYTRAAQPARTHPAAAEEDRLQAAIRETLNNPTA